MRQGFNERLIEVPAWFATPHIQYSDLATVVRFEFHSIADAEAYAQQMSVNAVYGSYLAIANQMNEVLTQLAERNLRLPLSVIASPQFFRGSAQESKNAVAKSENRVIFINPAATFWYDTLGATVALYELKFWSTPHPLHALYHEMGHLLQLQRVERQKPLTAREAGIADVVSDRAKQDADEFVAEVFAGLISGVKYDRFILRMYRRFGGVLP
jgi:hypothetical protein